MPSSARPRARSSPPARRDSGTEVTTRGRVAREGQRAGQSWGHGPTGWSGSWSSMSSRPRRWWRRRAGHGRACSSLSVVVPDRGALVVAQQPAPALLDPDRGALDGAGGAGGHVAQQHHAGGDLIGDELGGLDAVQRGQVRQDLLPVQPPSARADLGAGGVQQFGGTGGIAAQRSEEHTSELQSRGHLVCRLLLEKKKYQRTSRKRNTTVKERT